VQGDNIAAITKKTKDVDAALRVMDFLASDEGWMLTHYGIEGTHYDMVNGKPVPKKEWADKFAADPTGAIMQNQGFGFVNSPYGNLTGLRRTFSLGNGEIFADPAEANAFIPSPMPPL
jgi:putative aldouronate transport system substrate-binding protein